MTPLSLQTRFYWDASRALNGHVKMHPETIRGALLAAAGSDNMRLARAADGALRVASVDVRPCDMEAS